MNNYHNLFISHSWKYDNHYWRLIEFLDNAADFYYKDYSVPKNDPIHTNGSDDELYQAIYNKIKFCHIILMPSGIYASYSRWINLEIEIAKNGFKQPKPVLAISPRGQKKHTNLVQAADAFVKWNSNSIIKAIETHSLL